MKKVVLVFLVFCFLMSCKKDSVHGLSTNSNDLFYLQNDKSQMPVKVQGNTASKIFILVIHGGPGGEAIGTYNGGISEELKKNYGLVYWDQRNGGSTQGHKGGRLSLQGFVEDMEQVVALTKQLYGKDIKMFVYAHSWGGLLSSAYMTKGNNQQEMAGWIDIDGSHNYHLNDILTKNMMDSIGRIEIKANRNTKKWQEIVDYCSSIKGEIGLKDAYKLNKYSFKAEQLIDSIATTANGDYSQSPSIMSGIANGWFIGLNYNFYKELQDANYSTELKKVKTPVLLCWGKHDFVVPIGMGRDAYFNLGTDPKDKQLVQFNYSGHSPMYNQTKVFNEIVISFIEKYR